MLYGIFFALLGAAVLFSVIMLLARGFRKHPHGLAIAMGVLWIGSWILHGATEWQDYTHQQQTHNEPVKVGEFASVFYRASLENIQSEYLQLFSFVVLTSYLLYLGSAESKDSEERIEEMVRRLAEHMGVDTVDEDWSMEQQE